MEYEFFSLFKNGNGTKFVLARQGFTVKRIKANDVPGASAAVCARARAT